MNRSLRGLDMECVAYLRRVRDCKPTMDEAKARRLVSRLQKVAEQIEGQMAPFEEVAAEFETPWKLPARL